MRQGGADGTWLALGAAGVLAGAALVRRQGSRTTTSFALPPLPWPEDAMEPWLSRRAVSIHYHGHHAGYIRKLNEKLAQYAAYPNLPWWWGQPLDELAKNAAPDVQPLAGQAWNHAFYWEGLSPRKQRVPAPLLKEIVKEYGSFETFRDEFTAAALDVFGSGWAWLVRTNRGLGVRETPNWQSPADRDVIPLLCCDVWEHAYYLDHPNDRAAYLAGFWDHVNWTEVARRYSALIPVPGKGFVRAFGLTAKPERRWSAKQQGQLRRALTYPSWEPMLQYRSPRAAYRTSDITVSATRAAGTVWIWTSAAPERGDHQVAIDAMDEVWDRLADEDLRWSIGASSVFPRISLPGREQV
jgi:Fe-Mn family superoxide dismutase